MVYEYKCPICDKHIDIDMPMSEVNNISEETKSKLRCPGYNYCEFITEDEKDLCDKIIFVRDYSSIQVLSFDMLTPLQKQAALKKRASADFKKNVEEKKRDLQGTAIKQLRNLPKI